MLAAIVLSRYSMQSAFLKKISKEKCITVFSLLIFK